MADQVIAATEALFNSENAAHKNEADKWLEQWQQSTDAWTVSDSILHNPSSPATAVYFCAQTLKTKVRPFRWAPALFALHQHEKMNPSLSIRTCFMRNCQHCMAYLLDM
jgi:hypothetical protein